MSHELAEIEHKQTMATSTSVEFDGLPLGRNTVFPRPLEYIAASTTQSRLTDPTARV